MFPGLSVLPLEIARHRSEPRREPDHTRA